MKFSFWNQYFSHVHESEHSPAVALEKLRDYYQRKGGKLIEISEGSFCIEKGSIIMSIIGFGPETWLKHLITVSANAVSAEKTQISININLKIPGFTIGKNFLLDEAKAACSGI